MFKHAYGICTLLVCAACTYDSTTDMKGSQSPWLLVDDFEAGPALENWTNIDVQNDTDPLVPNPQISEIRIDPETGNHYMLRKPTADGVVGNREAPYGNGGVRYDDIYMAPGRTLSSPCNGTFSRRIKWRK